MAGGAKLLRELQDQLPASAAVGVVESPCIGQRHQAPAACADWGEPDFPPGASGIRCAPSPALDPVAKIAEVKYCAVRVEAVAVE